MGMISQWRLPFAKEPIEPWMFISKQTYRLLLVNPGAQWETGVQASIMIWQPVFSDFVHCPTRVSTPTALLLIMSRMVVMSWQKRCLVAHWICTTAEGRPFTKLDIGTASCTLSKGNLAQRTTLETTSMTLPSNLHLQTVVLPRRIPAQTPLDWMRFMILWTIRLMYAMSALRPDRESACEACGPRCDKGNSALDPSTKTFTSRTWAMHIGSRPGNFCLSGATVQRNKLLLVYMSLLRTIFMHDHFINYSEEFCFLLINPS